MKVSNEEHQIRKSEIKSQKDVLSDLYFNRNRPQWSDLKANASYFVVPSDFVREWRAMIKNSKPKSIRILNKTLICEHQKLPFNVDNFDITL